LPAVALAKAGGEKLMPTYVTLLTLTQKGVETIKQSPQRVEAARQMAKAAGGEIKAVYYTMGQYDAVVISEAPDDETAVRTMLTAALQGNVRSETLRAFPADEFMKIVKQLP
jgi:uncharacterized protein with GYD domain